MQLPAAPEHFDAAMVNAFVPRSAVMGHGSALMVVMRGDVVSYYSDHDHSLANNCAVHYIHFCVRIADIHHAQKIVSSIHLRIS